MTAAAPLDSPVTGSRVEPFASDEAYDALADIAKAAVPQKELAGFLTRFGRMEERIWSDDWDGAVAAACLVASRLTERVFGEEAAEWLEGIPFIATEELCGLAAGVLDRVVRPGDNEYYEWYADEPEVLSDWLGRLAWYRLLLVP